MFTHNDALSTFAAQPAQSFWPGLGSGAIRKLFSTDLPLFRDHLLRLDAESRRNRFIGGVSDDFIVAYAERCFSTDAVVFGYVINGEVRGAAELHPTDEGDSATAEAAFSVEPDLRGRGIGAALFDHLIRCARNYGILHLRMNCLAHNRAMQALARKFQAKLVLDRWETIAHLDAKAPTLFTLYSEALNDAIDFTKAAFSLQRRIWWNAEPKSGRLDGASQAHPAEPGA